MENRELALTMNHNTLALNAARNMGKHQDVLSRILRRLATGLRISSAADGPADVAISALGKAKASALAQASRNIHDASSLTETASGHLTVIDAMLNRIVELTQQAATGTYNTTQRAIIQNEVVQLVSEIERAGKAADFNGIRLLAQDSELFIQTGPGSADTYSLGLTKGTATTLGGSLTVGQKAYRRISIDGGSAGTAKVGATLADSIQQSYFGNQTITLRNAGDARTVTINSTQNNNSTKDILAALENTEMDGLRSAGSITTAEFSAMTKSGLGASEGDVVQFDVDIAHGTQSNTTSVSFLIGHDDATTLDNVAAALRRVAQGINSTNQDSDLTVTDTTLQSQSGRRISVGNLEFVDSAGIRIRDIQGASDPQDNVTFTVAGITVTTANTSHSAAMDTVYNQLVAGLSASGQLFDPAQYLASTVYTEPMAADGMYVVRRDGTDDSVVVTRIATSQAGVQSIQSSIAGASLTQALASGFGATAGREVYLEVDGVQVHYTASGNNGVSAQSLANALNAAGIANVSASVSGSQTVIRKTSQPTQAISLDGYFENRTARLSGFAGPAGENVSFSLNGQNISFTTGATLAINTQRIYNAIVAANPANITASLNLGAGSITLANSVDAAITFSGYNDGGNNNTSLTVTALYGAVGSQTLTAAGVNATAVNNPGTSSIQIAPGANSSGGGTLNSGASLSVARDSVQLTLSGVDGQSTFSSGTTLDSAANNTSVATRVDGGARSAALASLHGSAAQLTSGQSNWATVNGVGYILVDANTSFEVSSSEDGTGLSNGKGAFFSAAGQNTTTEYITADIQASVRISDYLNNAGDTVSMSIEGVEISFQAQGSDQQASNANAFYTAILANHSALEAAGVSYARSENDEWIYLTKDSGTLSITNYRDNNAAFDSGITIRGIDESRSMQLMEGRTVDAELTPFVPISQLDLMTQAGAGHALSILRQAITLNAASQAALGAAANSLSDMDAFVGIDRESTEAMVARITDADIAFEMMEYTRRMILTQASQAMLAQANIMPRQLLKLLGGKVWP